MLVIRRANIIFMCFPTPSFVSHFFILRLNQVFTAIIALLPCGCAVQDCMHDAQVFLQLVPSENTIDAQLFLWPQHLPHSKLSPLKF